MTTFSADYLANNMDCSQIPLWMKAERYEYCDSFFATLFTENSRKKILSKATRLLSFFL